MNGSEILLVGGAKEESLVFPAECTLLGDLSKPTVLLWNIPAYEAIGQVKWDSVNSRDNF